MSILGNNIEKFTEFDVLINAITRKQISFEEFLSHFPHEHHESYAIPGMCLMLIGKMSDPSVWWDGLFWYFIKISKEYDEVIAPVMKLNALVYSKCGKYPEPCAIKSAFERWFFVDPEYFEHIKSQMNEQEYMPL